MRKLNAEQRAVLARIAGLVEFWRITPDELAGAAPPVKYRHPLSGRTWDGRGMQPDWLRHALLKEGYLVSELSPQAASAASVAA